MTLAKPKEFPKQEQSLPGDEYKMSPHPQSLMENYKPASKLKDKVAIVTGGDSGIGRATAIGFAKEGADVAIIYLEEDKDAEETARHIEKAGRRCLKIRGDLTSKQFCEDAVAQTVKEFGKLNILVNNAAEQHEQKNIEDISQDQLERTFATNIFAMFYMTQAAMKHLHEGDAIINTTSITAFRGSEHLLDYASTKGAIAAFTRSLSTNLAEKKIRVNAVAPGPIWTPLIVASFDAEKSAKFGQDTVMGRAGQPDEVATCFIFLASDDASYITGQTLHPNGGTVVNT